MGGSLGCHSVAAPPRGRLWRLSSLVVQGRISMSADVISLRETTAWPADIGMTLQDDNHCTDVTIDAYRATNCRMALSVKSWGNATTDKVTISNSVFSFIGIPEPGLGGKIASMPFDQWPYFPSYGAYFRNVAEVVLDDVSFSTIGPDDRDDVFTDNVGSLTR